MRRWGAGPATVPMVSWPALAWTCLLSAGCAGHGNIPAPAATLAPLEHQYERLRSWDDQTRLMASLASDTTPDGLSRAAVADSLAAARSAFTGAMSAVDSTRLGESDRRAFAVMLQAWGEGLSGDSSSDRPGTDSLSRLTQSVYADYGRAAQRIVVDGDTLNRLAILGRLGREPDRERRRRLFLALGPVWQSVNGDNTDASPYRRLVRLRREKWHDRGSPIEAKAPAFGLTIAELERWLTGALREWRAAMPDTLLEPWDWYYYAGESSRRLTPRVAAVADLARVNRSFYASLGADPDSLGIHYDLLPRAGKDPVAFTDFGSRSRQANGGRMPAEPWVFTAYLEGGFDNLSELLHETGHGIHIAAIRTRPAWNDWPDNDTFTEALADLAAMELYQPSWQQRFLGDSTPLAASLRARYAGIMMDMAWALFEIQVHRSPAVDPNRLWSEITSTWLGIVPHPEWSWWAMRGQLIESPGYLVNYALGSFLTEDLRTRAARRGHPIAADQASLYTWLSQTLFRWGRERSSREVLEEFLGRPVGPDALLADLRRMQARRRSP